MNTNRGIATLAVLVVLVLLGMLMGRPVTGAPIKVGLIAELTGDIPAVGQSSKNGAELAVKQINNDGGILINGKHHSIALSIEDNAGSADQTTQVAQKLINETNVAAIIGPNASRYAIPAAAVAEQEHTVLISPWSTNPATTLDDAGQPKRYVFRAAYTDPFQGRVLAKFARNDLKKNRAAIFADSTAAVLVGQATYFRDTYESAGGDVVANQQFKAGDTSVSTQLEEIKKANPDIIFLPAYYNDTASIIKQARSMGITTTFLGSDAWGSEELLKNCGQECNGSFLSAHYSADSTASATKRFVTDYKDAYNATPDDVAALSYDSVKLLVQAIKKAGSTDDREAIRTGLASISNFAGTTGRMTFNGQSGDPVKGAVILEIKDGKLAWHSDVQP